MLRTCYSPPTYLHTQMSPQYLPRCSRLRSFTTRAAGLVSKTLARSYARDSRLLLPSTTLYAASSQTKPCCRCFVLCYRRRRPWYVLPPCIPPHTHPHSRYRSCGTTRAGQAHEYALLVKGCTDWEIRSLTILLLVKTRLPNRRTRRHRRSLRRSSN